MTLLAPLPSTPHLFHVHLFRLLVLLDLRTRQAKATISKRTLSQPILHNPQTNHLRVDIHQHPRRGKSLLSLVPLSNRES
jgi:hypothetical protein